MPDLGLRGLQLLLEDVEQGLCALDVCISSLFLEELEDQVQEVALRHLINHAALHLVHLHDVAVVEVAEFTSSTSLTAPPSGGVNAWALAEVRVPYAANAEFLAPFRRLLGHRRLRLGKGEHIAVLLSLLQIPGFFLAPAARRRTACSTGIGSAEISRPVLLLQEHAEEGVAVGDRGHLYNLASLNRRRLLQAADHTRNQHQ